MQIPFFENAEKKKQRLIELDLKKLAKAEAANAKRLAKRKAWDRFWFRTKLMIVIVSAGFVSFVGLVVYLNSNSQQQSKVSSPQSFAVLYAPPSSVVVSPLFDVFSSQPLVSFPLDGVIPKPIAPSLPRSLLSAPPVEKKAGKPLDSKQEKSDGNYWLNTSTGKRHNSGCKYFGDTKKGRACSKADGKACDVCGG